MPADASNGSAFRYWLSTVRKPTAISLIANLLVTSLVALMLLGAHRIVTGAPLSLSTAHSSEPLQNVGATSLVLLLLLLTLTAVLQSAIARLDARLIRGCLRRAAQGIAPSRAGREVLGTRLLLESWFRSTSTSTQALGYSIALAAIGGPTMLAAVTIALGSAALVSRSYVGVARDASLNFVQVRGALRRRQGRKAPLESPNPRVSDDDKSLILIDALYVRDTQALRLPISYSVVLSLVLLGIVLCAVIWIPPDFDLVLTLLLILVWRQRGMDAVQSLGPLIWAWVHSHSQPTSGQTSSDD